MWCLHHFHDLFSLGTKKRQLQLSSWPHPAESSTPQACLNTLQVVGSISLRSHGPAYEPWWLLGQAQRADKVLWYWA